MLQLTESEILACRLGLAHRPCCLGCKGALGSPANDSQTVAESVNLNLNLSTLHSQDGLHGLSRKAQQRSPVLSPGTCQVDVRTDSAARMAPPRQGRGYADPLRI